jgi:hypothetical protein
VVVKQSRKSTAYTITFAASLNAASANNLSLYQVFGGVTKSVKKHRQTAFTKPLRIKTAVYDPGTTSVTISLARPYKGAVNVTIEPGLEAASGASTSAALTQTAP